MYVCTGCACDLCHGDQKALLPKQSNLYLTKKNSKQIKRIQSHQFQTYSVITPYYFNSPETHLLYLPDNCLVE